MRFFFSRLCRKVDAYIDARTFREVFQDILVYFREVFQDILVYFFFGFFRFLFVCPPAYYLSQVGLRFAMRMAVILDYWFPNIFYSILDHNSNLNLNKSIWFNTCYLWRHPKDHKVMAKFLEDLPKSFGQRFGIQRFEIKDRFEEQVFLWGVDGSLDLVNKKDWPLLLSYMQPKAARFIASRLRSTRRYRDCVTEYFQ